MDRTDVGRRLVVSLSTAGDYALPRILLGLGIAGLVYWRLGQHERIAPSVLREKGADTGERPVMLETTHQWLMTLRPMSQLVRLFVIPEIDLRVTRSNPARVSCVDTAMTEKIGDRSVARQEKCLAKFSKCWRRITVSRITGAWQRFLPEDVAAPETSQHLTCDIRRS